VSSGLSVLVAYAWLWAAVFRLFGRPKHGVTWEDFQRQVHTRLGIILTEAEARELFNQFDPEGTYACGVCARAVR